MIIKEAKKPHLVCLFGNAFNFYNIWEDTIMAEYEKQYHNELVRISYAAANEEQAITLEG
jgi:hypothetical protein